MDPHANPHPERLDLQRKPNRHIAFGTGIHFCLGHQLARIEGRCALKSLFRRWPELTLAVDESEVDGASGPASGRSTTCRWWKGRIRPPSRWNWAVAYAMKIQPEKMFDPRICSLLRDAVLGNNRR
jgi:hypothetical protein